MNDKVSGMWNVRDNATGEIFAWFPKNCTREEVISSVKALGIEENSVNIFFVDDEE